MATDSLGGNNGKSLLGILTLFTEKLFLGADKSASGRYTSINVNDAKAGRSPSDWSPWNESVASSIAGSVSALGSLSV